MRMSCRQFTPLLVAANWSKLWPVVCSPISTKTLGANQRNDNTQKWRTLTRVEVTFQDRLKTCSMMMWSAGMAGLELRSFWSQKTIWFNSNSSKTRGTALKFQSGNTGEKRQSTQEKSWKSYRPHQNFNSLCNRRRNSHFSTCFSSWLSWDASRWEWHCTSKGRIQRFIPISNVLDDGSMKSLLQNWSVSCAVWKNGWMVWSREMIPFGCSCLFSSARGSLGFDSNCQY